MSSSMQERATECVAIEWFTKFYQCQRHLDIIIRQLERRVGPFNRVHIIDKPTKTMAINNGCTFAYIELKDTAKHEELITLIDQYRFHGHSWSATHSKFYFTGMDECYWPRPTSCNECAAYSQALEKWEASKKSKATTNSKSVHFDPSILSEHEITVPIIQSTLKSKINRILCSSCNSMTKNAPFCQYCENPLQISDNLNTACVATSTNSIATPSANALSFKNDQHQQQSKPCSPCVGCGTVNAALIQPTIRDSHLSQCTHSYCISCFNRTATFMSDTIEDKPIWDGYPVVSFDYRFKCSPNLIWSCQACRASTIRKTK